MRILRELIKATTMFQLRIVLIALTLLLPLLGHSQKDKESIFDQKRDKIKLSERELLLRLSDFLSYYVITVEAFTEEIYRESTDKEIKRAALMWRIYGSSAMSKAINISDPIVATYNGWSLAKQIAEFYDTGVGKESLGPYQEEAVEMCYLMENKFDSIVVLTSSLDNLHRVEPIVDDWVSKNKIDNYYFARESPMKFFAKWVGDQHQGLGGEVKTMSQEIQELSDRINLYANLIPRQARWQADYAMLNFTSDSLLNAQLLNMLENMDEITEIAANSPALIEYNREALLKEIDRQRIESLDLVTIERLALIDALVQERITVIDALVNERIILLEELRKERQEVMVEAEELSMRLIEHSSEKAMNIIDAVLLRIAIFLILCFAILMIFYMRFIRRKV